MSVVPAEKTPNHILMLILYSAYMRPGFGHGKLLLVGGGASRSFCCAMPRHALSNFQLKLPRTSCPSLALSPRSLRAAFSLKILLLAVSQATFLSSCTGCPSLLHPRMLLAPLGALLVFAQKTTLSTVSHVKEEKKKENFLFFC